MLLAYVLIFLLHLSASTCNATSRNQHLFFAGRADDTTALLPAIRHHHHRHRHRHRHTGKVLPDYNDVRHYHPAMMARWEGAPPRPPSSPSVELAGIGGSPPPSLSAMELGGVEGAPPPPTPRKKDTSAAMEPSPSPPHGEGASSSDASATGQEESPSDDVDVDVDADYDGPMTHPPSHN